MIYDVSYELWVQKYATLSHHWLFLIIIALLLQQRHNNFANSRIKVSLFLSIIKTTSMVYNIIDNIIFDCSRIYVSLALIKLITTSD